MEQPKMIVMENQIVKLLDENYAAISKKSIRIFNGDVWINIKPSDIYEIKKFLDDL